MATERSNVISLCEETCIHVKYKTEDWQITTLSKIDLRPNEPFKILSFTDGVFYFSECGYLSSNLRDTNSRKIVVDGKKIVLSNDCKVWVETNKVKSLVSVKDLKSGQKLLVKSGVTDHSMSKIVGRLGLDLGHISKSKSTITNLVLLTAKSVVTASGIILG